MIFLADFRLVARIEIHQNLLRSIRRYTTFFNICAEGILDLETLAWHSCDEKGVLNLATFTLSKKKQDYNQQKSFDFFPNPFQRNPKNRRYKEITRVEKTLKKSLEDTGWIYHMARPGPCLHSKADLTERYFLTDMQQFWDSRFGVWDSRFGVCGCETYTLHEIQSLMTDQSTLPNADLEEFGVSKSRKIPMTLNNNEPSKQGPGPV